MSTLEDLLPEMAGVFAAQESALANCVAVLTTQLQNLGLDCSRQLRRVATLETSQRSLIETITTLRATLNAVQLQHEELTQQHAAQSDALEDLRELAVAASGLKATLSHEIEAQTAAVVHALVTEHLTTLETKLTQQTLEASNRAFLRAKQSDELFQGQLEMLEKRFDFLSKLKMEIKDLAKRMDKQDQTLDDMRTGLALLSKSVGSDEIDDDEDGDTARKADVSSRQKQALANDASAVSMAEPALFDPPMEETAEPATDEPSLGEHDAPQPQEEESEASEMLPVVEETDGEGEAAEDLPPKSPDVQLLPSPSDQVEEVDVSAIEEPQELPPVIEEPHPEETLPSSVESTEIVPPVPQPESETPPPSEALQEEQMPETPPPVEDNEQPPMVMPIPPVDVAPLPVQSPLPYQSPAESPNRVDELEDETGGTDDFQSVRLPHPPAVMHRMPTVPNLSTVAYIRSRRQERAAKRMGSRHDLTVPYHQLLPPRVPLSVDGIKANWMRIFNKIVQLKRLQSINGTSPERTIFRKQNLSMGARVKRLEETSGDLEDTMEMLESTIQGTGATLQTLSLAVTQSTTTLEKKTRKLDDAQRMQAQSIVGMEEKFEALDAEFRRMRNVARRDSSQGSVATAIMTQVAAQMHDLTDRLSDHSKSVDEHEHKLHQLLQTDLPSLTATVQSTVLEMRTEVDFKTRTMGKDLVHAVETLRAEQKATQQTLERQLTACTDGLYRDLLVLTSANLVAVELASISNAASKATNSPTKKLKQKSSLDISVGLLHSVLATFETECRKIVGSNDDTSSSVGMDSDTEALASVLMDKLHHFRLELAKLKEQADKASAISITAVGGEGSSISGSSTTRGFEEHLVRICTNQLRMLEEILVAQSHVATSEQNASLAEAALIGAYVKDLVVQFRAVLFLLVLHAQLVEPPQQIQKLETAHASMETVVTSHTFALSQFATVEAVVKMMNSRLDSFMDMSFSFAKDADVKKSIQEMLDANDELRENVGKQVESTNGNAVKRDELIERELAQLAGRVHKKLDKDEMLWTQEVLERQLQNVAKGALGEQDLVDIQRALRAKMDKTQFQALLLQQQAKLHELGGGGNGSSMSLYGSGGGNQPLAATRCISCDSDLSASPSPQLRATIKEEVQQEVARALAAAGAKHQPAPSQSSLPSSSSSSSSSFNVSSHRSMDKHKRELLLAALQQQQQRK